MKRRRVWLFLVMSIAWMLFYIGSVVSGAEHEHAILVGKRGEVQFQSEVRVGDLTLKAGTYRVQRRVEGPDHFVHFADGRGEASRPDEIKCRLEPLARIIVEGENVAHVF